MINELEEDGVLWTITTDLDSAIKAIVRGILEDAWKEALRGCGYELAEAVHSMNKTKTSFRLVCKRELRRQANLFDAAEGKFHYHVVATNWPEEQKDTQAVFAWHNQRGQAENFNKELKGGFGQDGSLRPSFANAVYFRVGVIAYNLFIGFKRLAGPAAWAHHTISTFRWKLIQTAGRIVRHAGQVILRLAVNTEKLILFQDIRQRCYRENTAM